MKIPLTKGYFALVDDDAPQEVVNHKWCALVTGGDRVYAMRRTKEGGKVSYVLMHRIVANAQKGEIVDHKNHNTLDNRRENVRICKAGENLHIARQRSGS